MQPWTTIDRTPVPDGTELVLAQRGDALVIRIGGNELMNSRQHASEEALATMGLAHVPKGKAARVLIGGLGMGFTLRAALDVLAGDARVDVAELVPGVVRWNREHLGHLAKYPLRDKRVRIIDGDVANVIERSPAGYDAILLDVDNGPDALTAKSNSRLYGPEGLRRAAAALRPDGVFALWSVAKDAGFTKRLNAAGFDGRWEWTPARTGVGAKHVVWLAKLSPVKAPNRERAERLAGAERKGPRWNAKEGLAKPASKGVPRASGKR